MLRCSLLPGFPRPLWTAWVRRSAESGFALAQSSLAMDYLKSQETKGEARQWAERSAKQGDATGLYILVITDTDPKVQLEHLRAAASKGLPQAQRDMARMLFTQTMKTSDSKIKGGLVLEAFSWSLKGALQGEPSSMCLAASALNAISRIPPEAEWAVEKAYMWTLKCIEHGSEARKVLGEGLPGEETRQDLYKRLSFEAVERANKEAAEWKPAPAGVVRHGHFETPASARTER